MKWVIRAVALLSTCSIFTLLRFTVFPYMGGLVSGLLTAALFSLGVWFVPSRIIKRLEARKPAPPSPPPSRFNAPVHRETLYNFTVDGQSICVPESQLAAFQQAQERKREEGDVSPAPPEPEMSKPAPAPEPKRRPIPSYDKVGYQLAVLVLAGLAFVAFINFSSSRSQLEKAEDTIEELEYELGNSYDDGYEAGLAEGFDEGYADGVGDYAPEVGFFRQNACIVTVTGSKYHHWGCYHTSGSRYYIYNVELAESYGYTPCEDCWEDGLLVNWNP